MKKLRIDCRRVCWSWLVIAFVFPSFLMAQERENTGALSIDELRAIENKIVAVAKKVTPAVVCIQAGGGSGSGVIVSEDGLVLTAAHVIDKAEEFTVRYPDGRAFKAKRLGMFASRDAGMIQLTEGAPHPFAEVGHSGTLSMNDWVIALGHPGGFDEDRRTPLRIGHVMGNGHWLTSDCALIGGDSGGPSFDLAGRVIGIHSNISGSISANNDVPIDVYHDQWDFMKSGKTSGTVQEALAAGEKKKSVLGLTLDQADGPEADESNGKENNVVRIEAVLPGSPAADAGLQAGDIMLTLNGEQVQSAGAFLAAIDKLPPGTQIKLSARRGEKTQDYEIRLTSKADLRKRHQEKKKQTPSEKSGNGPRTPPPIADATKQNRPAAPKRRSTKDGEIVRRKTRIQQLLEQARKNGGRIKLDRSALNEIQEKIAIRMETLAPVGGRARDIWGQQFVDAFQPIVADYHKATRRVLLKKRPVALATLVSKSGLAITKHSEIAAREFQVEDADGNPTSAEIVAVADDLDLALIQIQTNATDTNDIIGFANSVVPQQGALCSAVGIRPAPAGVGAVSVVERSLSSATKAILGVNAETRDGLLVINDVKRGGPAEAGGLKKGDVILAIDQQEISSADELQAIVKQHLPEDKVRIDIRRGQSESTFEIELGDASKVAPMAGNREQGTDSMSTRRSRRRWSFRRGIQHDCAIQPKHCGGPLVDSRGRLIGINIARAGRIRSYAIPAAPVEEFVRKHRSSNEQKTANTSTEAGS